MSDDQKAQCQAVIGRFLILLLSFCDKESIAFLGEKHCFLRRKTSFCSQQLERIPFFLQKVEGAGEGVLQIAAVPRLEGVVESDDGAVAGVAHDVGQNLRAAELLAVVAGDEIPHDDFVLALQ